MHGIRKRKCVIWCKAEKAVGRGRKYTCYKAGDMHGVRRVVS